MEINETLVEADTLEQIQIIGQKNDADLQEYMMQASDLFKAHDFAKAKQILAKLKYYANIADKIKDYEMIYTEKPIKQ